MPRTPPGSSTATSSRRTSSSTRPTGPTSPTSVSRAATPAAPVPATAPQPITPPPASRPLTPPPRSAPVAPPPTSQDTVLVDGPAAASSAPAPPPPPKAPKPPKPPRERELLADAPPWAIPAAAIALAVIGFFVAGLLSGGDQAKARRVGAGELGSIAVPAELRNARGPAGLGLQSLRAFS